MRDLRLNPRITSRGGRRPLLIGLLTLAALAIVVAPVLAIRVPTDPEPDIACAEGYGTGWLTHYATTVETPAGSTDWWVSVEFTIAGEDADCELTLATYELGSSEFSFPQTLFDSENGRFGAGTHTLTAALPLGPQLPGCHAQYDFAFGPAIDELTFENRYDQRQIRARIVGSDECPSTATPTPTPSEGTAGGTPTPSPTPSEDTSGGTATPSPTPREDTAGGNPTPTPAGGNLPDTSLPMSATGSTLTGVLGLLLLGSIGALSFAHAESRRRNR